MITGNYTDDSNLASATIYDLGTGDNTGNTGTFSSIDDPDESISGVEGSIVRDFTFLANTPLGAYTFRTKVVDADSASDTAWGTVNVQNISPTVSLTVSSTEITLGQEVTLTATADDSDGSVTRVSFIRGKVFALDPDAPYTHTYTPAEIGEFTFYAQALDNDGAFTNSDDVTFTVIAAPPVVVQESETWQDIDNNGYLDQVLAKLEKPALLGISGSIMLNGVELRIDEVSVDYYDPFTVSNKILTVALTTVGFRIEMDHTYRVQFQDILESVVPMPPQDPPEWVDWSPILPEPGGPLDGYVWCDYENQWIIWAAIPESFRVVKYGKASMVIRAAFSEDVNGDGVDDNVQEISPEVYRYKEDSDELFIKVDCPDGVIGCDQDNTELVINDNGSWIIVDENQSIARNISPGDTDYPSSGVTPNDLVVAVAESTLPRLSFFFAEVTPVDSVTINTFIPHNNVEDPRPLNGTLYKGDDRQGGDPLRAIWNENGSHRTQQKFKIVAYELIDSNGLVDDAFGPSVDRYVHIGETRSFDPATSVDADGNLTTEALADTVKEKPEMIDFATGPKSQVSVPQDYPKYLGFKKLAIKCKSVAINPLVSGSPAIDYYIMITIDRYANTYSISGSHDGFPAYEIYINGTRVYEHDPLATGDGLGSLTPLIGNYTINIVGQPLP